MTLSGNPPPRAGEGPTLSSYLASSIAWTSCVTASSEVAIWLDNHDTGHREHLANMIPGEREHFSISWEYNDYTLEAYSFGEDRVTNTESVNDGMHWEVR